jgi:ribosomal protein L28
MNGQLRSITLIIQNLKSNLSLEISQRTMRLVG